MENIRKILKSDLQVFVTRCSIKYCCSLVTIQYVIGWYSYRHGSLRHLMSLREKAIHRSLLQLFSHIDSEGGY